MDSGSAPWWKRETLAIALGVVVLGLMVGPRNAAALTALLGALVFAGLVLALRFGDFRLPARGELPFVAVLSAPVLWLTVRAAFAQDPRIAFIGNLGQHQGALTWLAALLTLLAVACARMRGDAGRSVRAIAVVGAILGVGAALEVANVIDTATFSPEASGLVENSISLSQALVVSLGCAIAWWHGRRGKPESWAGAVCAALIIGGLVAAESNAAWLAAILAVLIVAAGWAASALGLPVPKRVWPVAVAVLSVAGVSALWLALRDGVDPGLETKVAALSNDRFTIWTSAVAKSARTLVAGSGPEQFSAWVTWDLSPQGAITTNATYDPHNTWLYFLLAGGIIAFLLAVLAAAAVIARLVSLRGVPATAATAGIVAFGVTAMFGWASPLALLMAAIVVGALIPFERESQSRHVAFGVAAAIGLCVALAVVVGVRGGAAEYEWARAVGLGTITTDKVVELAVATGDPSLASQALSQAYSRVTGGPEQIVLATRAITPVLEDASSWHVDAAFSRFQLAAISGSKDDPAAWGAIQAAVQDGERADAASGLWPTIAALQAAAWGRADDAEAFARDAFKTALPSRARERLEALSK